MTNSIIVTAYDIIYDADGDATDLPESLNFSFPAGTSREDVEEAVSDGISDNTGFCHKGFKLLYHSGTGNSDTPSAQASQEDAVQQLLTLGQAATQGQWQTQEGVEGAPDIVSGDESLIGCEGFWSDMDQDWKNAEYIAAACPEVIMPLLRELQALRQQRAP